ncbi:hypothetical protein GCM10022409_14520 [Hymenobacter glaciei]|uniref:Uncharacterized protein n=1 Tax=Hymenobacter glaciei TaxID=877209 RepID=A0ABP7TUU4_9BACT
MKKFAYLLLSCAALTTASSCSKEKEVAPTGPKEYQVEYKVTSNASVADYLSYDNESGGSTTLSNVALPATYSFKRTMKLGDHVGILASLPSGSPATSEITASISLDGKEVKKETGRGSSAQAVPVWVIGQ